MIIYTLVTYNNKTDNITTKVFENIEDANQELITYTGNLINKYDLQINKDNILKHLEANEKFIQKPESTLSTKQDPTVKIKLANKIAKENGQVVILADDLEIYTSVTMKSVTPNKHVYTW